ncbi:TonB-linked SusC/RagA family outer membrane protein [Dyadobacter jejuensis]|uniref:TonB-linked SusC/RagA family outer membrane protein n=1 Tax=Dyadobacter jejuensis TaxID=1082580 RepID=A0A316AJY7_9BACT|nr:TonB-dependent receptor [Dyadobacter jejuensis]PWJ57668.1 TonB-linked SusC/RagA family outer membrane protein [Dyadobacter jejuensis]
MNKKLLPALRQRCLFLTGLFIGLVLMACPTMSYGQGITVEGTVLDAHLKESIPGVSIRIVGSTKGVLTDETGKFTIADLPANATLIFSYIGFQKKEIQIKDSNPLTIYLEEDINNLEETVVIGFGTQKKINLAGAVDQIAGKQLEARPVANVMQGLQGISPGLNITYSGGSPGSVPNFNIRGTSSINGGTPLIVIDGIPAADGYDLLRLNPSDIASFTVLRDAASAAIYGARAAFGVILITTKQGGGRQTISYNSYFSWSKPSVLPRPITDPYIFSRVLETSTDNTPWDYVNYSDEYYAWAKQRSDDPSLPDTRLNPQDPTKWAYMGNNDWYDYFFNNSSFSHKQGLSFSGGAQINQMPIAYYLSADYTKENGLNKLAADYWDRYGLKARTNFSPLKWLKIDNNLSIYQTKKELPRTSITDLYTLQPTDVAQNPDGTWANTTAGRLAAQLIDGGRNQENMFGFQNITSVIGTFLKGDLQVNADFSFKKEDWKYDLDAKKYNIGFGPGDVRQEGGNGYVQAANGNIQNNAINMYANYRKDLGIHGLNFLVGYNQESYVYDKLTSQRDQLISSSLPFIGLTTGAAILTSRYEAYATRSYFSRLNYTLNDRYILEFNGRMDGSSRFPTQRRWGFFPSVSGAWIASSESFMQWSKPAVSTLKLRTSYGALGNQSVGYFSYLQTLPAQLSSYLIDGAQRMIISSAPSLYIDPTNYTWERVATQNFGGDLGLWKNKLLLSYDYFIRNTTGMLTAGEELPGVLGTSAPSQNAADMRNQGWELSLAYQGDVNLASKPLSYSAKLVLSDSKSQITKFKNDQQLFSKYREGQSLGEIWGLESDGFFKNETEIDALDQSAIVPWGALEVIPGWPKYKDLNGDGKIETGLTAQDPKDLKIIGNSTQRYRVGFNLSADWNGFDASLFLQGVLKGDFYPRHYLFWGPYQQPYGNVYPWHLDYYRGTADSDAQRAKHSASYIAAGLADANTNPQYPVMQSWLADNNYGSGLDIPQTKYLLSAAYLRVKNVTLGYSLPQPILRKISLQRVRLFATAENIFEFSKIKKFVDPESINQGPSARAYPFQRKLAFGLNVEF